MEERADFAGRREMEGERGREGERELVAPGKTRVSSSWIAKVPARSLRVPAERWEAAGRGEEPWGRKAGGGGRRRLRFDSS